MEWTYQLARSTFVTSDKIQDGYRPPFLKPFLRTRTEFLDQEMGPQALRTLFFFLLFLLLLSILRLCLSRFSTDRHETFHAYWWQHSAPHLKCVATLPCEMFMSENSLLISEIHLMISLHFSFVKKQRIETSKMIVRYVIVIFFRFNIKYSMVFIEYLLRWISHSLSATSHGTR